MAQPQVTQSHQPGRQAGMNPAPMTIRDDYRGSGKLAGKVAVVSGGDSGIGRAVAVHFAREGADIIIAYLEENEDADETRRLTALEQHPCQTVRADLTKLDDCRRVIRQAVETWGRIDVLVHSVTQQFPHRELEEISAEQLLHTFQTNVFSNFQLTQAALPHMTHGGSIIFTGSVTGARGSPRLMDYASSKGAVHALTYSLAQSLAIRGIRVNLIAPGPIWTPLIPASFSAKEVAAFGSDTLMKRAGMPSEVGPAYVFLASEDSSYITGQIIHINGGGFIGS